MPSLPQPQGSALITADAPLRDNLLRNSNRNISDMPTATGESCERRTPNLVPLSHRRSGGGGRRSSSPATDRPISTPPPLVHGTVEPNGSLHSIEVTNTLPLPQPQSTQPRTTLVLIASPGAHTEDTAAVVSQASVKTAVTTSTAGVGLEVPTIASTSASVALPESLAAHTSITKHCDNSNNTCIPLGTTATSAAVAGASWRKTPKRMHKTAGGTNTYRRTSVSSGNGGVDGSSSSEGHSGGAAASRSVSERCKAARTLAAELMSALMERPPCAAQITQYRQSLRASAASTPSLTPGVAVKDGSACDPSLTELVTKPLSGQPPTESSGVAVPTAALLPSTASLSSHSFLEAVRNGRVKPSHTPSSTSMAENGRAAMTSPTVAFMAGGGTPEPTTSHKGSTRVRSDSPNVSPLPPARTYEGPSRKPLELLPEDTSTIPKLLSVLREVALSCASLDTLGQTSNTSASASLSCSNSSRHGTAAATPGFPATAASAISVKGRATSVTTSPQATEVPVVSSTTVVSTSRPPHETEINDYDEQWRCVRTHLQAVRELVLNGHEFASMLDDVLGVDWRVPPASTTTSTATAIESIESSRSNEVSMRSTPLPPPTTEDFLRTTKKATILTDALIAVRPTPVDHDGSIQPAVSAAGSEKGSLTTANTTTTLKRATSGDGEDIDMQFIATTSITTATTTTLNHNARPFHSQTPPIFQQPVSTQGTSHPTLTTATKTTKTTGDVSPPLHPVGLGGHNGGRGTVATPNSSSHTDAHHASSSMKQLSENSSTYSPSQHLATLLERCTPPAPTRMAEEGDAGLLNFPSTPLSEAAAPYQPSATLVGGTSPRGASTSTSSSTPFHLESREEMLRRRSAAPNAFYASMTHSGATHYLGGPSSAASPGTFVPASVSPGSPSFPFSAGSARSMPVSPLLSYGSPATASQCPYDYLLVLDFEATCEEHPPPNYLYEIIEFPVVVVDVRLQRVVAEFHRFVRPRHKVELSNFCKELTGMRQEDVDAAAPLEEVIVQFERWFAHTVPPHARCVFVTDGPMDMREFMYRHSVSRQCIRFPPLFYQYIDVKQTFACFFHCSQGKIKAMLEVLHIPFEGRLHSGLDDARNIAAIVIGLLQYGCNFCEVPLNRLPLNRLLLSSATAGAAGNGSTPLSLPLSTAATGSGRHRTNGASPTCITAPYSVDEDEYPY